MIFKALKPWLNIKLYCEEKEQELEKKKTLTNFGYETELAKQKIDFNDKNNDKEKLNEIENEITRDISG